MRLVRASIACALVTAVAPHAHAQQPQQPLPQPTPPPTGEELARFRHCTHNAPPEPVEAAQFAAECAERLSDRIPEAAGILAFRAARAFVTANGIGAAVRWAMLCHERALPNANVALGERLRRECSAIVRAHFRSVAWLRNDSPRCRWSVIEPSFADNPARVWVSIPWNQGWIAVRPEVTQIQVTCDIPDSVSRDVSEPIGNVTATLAAGRRYHLAATVTVRPE